jgi:TIR domain
MKDNTQIRKWIAIASEYASFAGVGLVVIVMIATTAEKLKLSEAIVGGATLLATGLVGLGSMYLARAAKSVSMHKRVFISYSSDQKETAQKLREALLKKGARVWLDVTDLQPGSDFNASTNAAIESSNTVMAVVSQQIGPTVSTELQSAFAKHVPVVAVMPQGVDRPKVLDPAAEVIYFGEVPNIDAIATTVLQTRP